MVNKAVWALAALVPAGAGVWWATRDAEPPAVAQQSTPAPAGGAVAAAQKPEPYDPGKPTPEISAERKAIEALGKSKVYSPETEARLVKALSHIDQDVRGHGAWGLGELAPATRGALEPLLKALGDEVWAVQHNAAWALSRFERADVEGRLVETLGDALPIRRIRAAKALLELDAVAFSGRAEATLNASYEAANGQARSVAIQAMGLLKPVSESTVALLASALAAEDDNLVSSAVTALGALGPAAQSAVPVLVTVHKHKKQDVRRSVATALGQIGLKSPLVFETLLAMFEDSKDGPADLAAQALARLEAWDVLDEAFATRGPRSRRFVVSAWRQDVGEEGRRRERLIKALADSDPKVRLAAAGAFLNWEVPEAVPALALAMGDEDGAVAGHARTALERMTNPAAKAALAKRRP